MSQPNVKSVTFAASVTSAEIDLGYESPVNLEIPATFGITSVKFQQAVKKGGTYSDIYLLNADMTQTLFQFVVDSSQRNISLTNVFPAGSRFIKVVVNTPITGTANLSTKSVS